MHIRAISFFVCLGAMLSASHALAIDKTPEEISSAVDALPSDIWHAIGARFRYDAPRDINEGLMFSYGGPLGWSKPDWRLIVRHTDGIGKDARYQAEIIKLDIPLKVLVADWYEQGIKDKEALWEKIATRAVRTDSIHCTGMIDGYREVISHMTEIPRRNPIAADQDLHSPQTVPVDGGANWDLTYYAHYGLETVEVSTQDSKSPVVAAIDALGEQIRRCANNVAK